MLNVDFFLKKNKQTKTDIKNNQRVNTINKQKMKRKMKKPHM